MQDAFIALSVFGGIAGCLGVVLLFVYRMRRQDLEFKYGKAASDINLELADTIKTEFTRLRQDNAEFRKRLEVLEQNQSQRISLNDLTPESKAELVKQLQAEKHNFNS